MNDTPSLDVRPKWFKFDFNGTELDAFMDEFGMAWFIGKQVCDALEIVEAHRSLASLDDDEKGRHTVTTPGGTQWMVTVNEPGLYSLVFRSRKAEAVKFRKWVTADVLPALRRMGIRSGDSIENIGQVQVGIVENGPALMDALREVKALIPDGGSLVAATARAFDTRVAAIVAENFETRRLIAEMIDMLHGQCSEVAEQLTAHTATIAQHTTAVRDASRNALLAYDNSAHLRSEFFDLMAPPQPPPEEARRVKRVSRCPDWSAFVTMWAREVRHAATAGELVAAAEYHGMLRTFLGNYEGRGMRRTHFGRSLAGLIGRVVNEWRISRESDDWGGPYRYRLTSVR